MCLGDLVRIGSRTPKSLFAFCQVVGFEIYRFLISISPDEYEIAVVGDQYLSISAQVAQYLFAGGNPANIFACAFDLDGTTSRNE